MPVSTRLTGTFLAAAMAFAQPALAGDVAETALGTPMCTNGQCSVKMTAEQLMNSAENLVLQHRFEEAAPLLAALENAPQFAMQRDFLIGYAAIEQGQTDTAIKSFRGVLASHPEQTRVRLELARALMMKGKSESAAYHFRVAQQDHDLPEDLNAMVRTVRGVLRTRQAFAFNVDLGFAPDSNITNGTNAETIDVALGPFIVPVTLDAQARAKSGTGQFLTLSGTARFGFVGDSRLLIEGTNYTTNYRGKANDDISADLAVGPEFNIADDTTLAVQALGSQRWHGGDRANTGYGLRASLQKELNGGNRFGFSLDARRTNSGFASAYDGWQFGGYASYEHGISKTLLASASVYARRDLLTASSYSDKEVGLSLGLAGELPLGLTAGVSGGVSKSWYDSPLGILSSSARNDLRLNGSFNLGLRSLRMMGFSPSVNLSYVKNQSNVTLFDSERKRIRFALARYF
jgi:outer membrane protein